MSARSQVYCNRARNRLVAMNSAALGAGVAAPDPAPVAAIVPSPATSSPAAPRRAPASTKTAQAPKTPTRPKDVYARYRQGTAAASRAYWAAHEARVGAIKARIEARWKRVASR